jgi:curved DNA-binding protein CbpA
MKPLPEQSHYEVLDILPNASAYEVGRAYRETRALYGEGALASYTFFSAEEREALLARVEEAYQVLSSVSRRADYDQELGLPGRVPLSAANGSAGHAAGPSPEARLGEKVRRGIVNGEAKRLLRRLATARWISGRDLRQLREAIGLTVEEIEAGSTVGVGLIPALEGDRSTELPSWLNLRDSLMAYAELLQADPQNLARGYLKHLAEQH